MAGSEDASGFILALTQLSTSLGELRRELADGLGEIRRGMNSKADRSEVKEIEVDVEKIDIRVKELEEWRSVFQHSSAALADQRARSFTRKEKVWGGVIGIAWLLSGYFGPAVAHAIQGR